jgi:hypothetical protein
MLAHPDSFCAYPRLEAKHGVQIGGDPDLFLRAIPPVAFDLDQRDRVVGFL